MLKICWIAFLFVSFTFETCTSRILDDFFLKNNYEEILVMYNFYDNVSHKQVLKVVPITSDKEKEVLLSILTNVKRMQCGCKADGVIKFIRSGKKPLHIFFYLSYDNVVFKKGMRIYSCKIDKECISLLSDYQQKFLKSDTNLEAYNRIVNIENDDVK